MRKKIPWELIRRQASITGPKVVKTVRINPYAAYQSNTAEGTREVKKELGKDEFLKILAAQFRGQNPLEPLKDTEFIAQMAQFSTLEQLQNIAAKLDVFEEDLVWNQYLALLGKELYALTTDDEFVEGVVTGITFKDGRFLFQIDGRDYDIAAIISVGVPLSTEPDPTMPPDEAVPEAPGVESGEAGDEAASPEEPDSEGQSADEAGAGEGGADD